MDIGRQHDLDKLNKVINDPNESVLIKRRARLALKKIEKVARDPHIAKLRTRLIKAHRADDTEEAEKIGQAIRSYQVRKYGYM